MSELGAYFDIKIVPQQHCNTTFTTLHTNQISILYIWKYDTEGCYLIYAVIFINWYIRYTAVIFINDS